MNQEGRKILIIAGPNGAGKTTFAYDFLMNEADCPTLVNADLIAHGLSPLQPQREELQAGRLMLSLIEKRVQSRENFAVETTLSGRGYARRIPRWQQMGYQVVLYYLMLPSPEYAIERVAERVRSGGHDVPADTVRRRFHAGRRNFDQIYRDIVDEWLLFDNRGDTPILLARRRNT